ncbi:MAG: FAD-dependent oxidoreductase [Phycisphaerae bacterium]|nr:FAD-dependent oxidoreductase [Phycisphaerae bacterium]
MSTTHPLRLVIVGGVAGGASAATRARRLGEAAQITLLERGEHVSFANCGLPYHIGGVIPKRESLLVQTPAGLKSRFNIDVRVRSEVVGIDPAGRTVTVRNQASGNEYVLPYDKLILAPGAAPIRPALPGVDLPGVLTLRNIADMDRINAAARGGAVVIVGAGYIGLEMAENLARRGLQVTLVEKLDQVFPLLDPEMAAPVAAHLVQHHVQLTLGDGLAGFAEAPGGKIDVLLASGKKLTADFAVLAVGVRPETHMAKLAGLANGPTGGIEVNEHMQTSQPDIYAVGDSVQVRDIVTGLPAVIPLAGPANRQGRIAASHIFAAQPDRYAGTQGTSIVGVFDLTVAMTGPSERSLRRAGIDFRHVHLHPANHAGYFPGSKPMHIKLLYTPTDGRVLGAQIVGYEGVDKRIDVLAVAVRHKLTVFDLEDMELAYAPAYGSAKDAVNMAGFIAANAIRGLTTPRHFAELADGDYVLDVRTPEEFALGHLPNATNIPVDQLRGRLAELPRDRRINAYCGVGLRAYVAERILKQNGYDCTNLSGGWKTWCGTHALDRVVQTGCAPQTTGGVKVNTQPEIDADTQVLRNAPAAPAVEELDARGLQCPGPILQLNKRMADLPVGRQVRVRASDPGFPADVKAWSTLTGNKLVESKRDAADYVAVVERANVAPQTSGAVATTPGGNGFTAVVFSGSMDRALAALVLANGAAANGLPTALFFTFWGLSILRKPKPARGAVRGLLDRMFAWMLPAGVRKLKLSQWHFAGAGRMLMNYRMKSKNVMSLEQLLASARAAGVRLVACQMSMDMLGLRQEDLLDGVELGGVATFMESASQGRVSLFI